MIRRIRSGRFHTLMRKGVIPKASDGLRSPSSKGDGQYCGEGEALDTSEEAAGRTRKIRRPQGGNDRLSACDQR